MAQKRPYKPGKHRKPEQILSFSEADDRLFDIFRHHDFRDFPHKDRHQLVRYYQLLMNQQKTENFTRLLKFRDIAIKHFIDCLMVPRLWSLEFPLLDIGTGPGLPGIPLKIVYPQEKILLAEGVRKRVEFLKKVREEMKLKELDIVGRYIDEEFMLPVKTVITRAVDDVNKTLKDIRGCLKIGGHMIFMKGPNVDPEIEKAKSDWARTYELVEDIEYSLPNTPHQRRLVIFRRQGE